MLVEHNRTVGFTKNNQPDATLDSFGIQIQKDSKKASLPIIPQSLNAPQEDPVL